MKSPRVIAAGAVGLLLAGVTSLGVDTSALAGSTPLGPGLVEGSGAVDTPAVPGDTVALDVATVPIGADANGVELSAAVLAAARADADAPATSSSSPAFLGTAANPLETQSVIGTDSRTRVNPTTGYPSRAIARISSTVGQCTGWLVSEDLLVTAGHCVHSGQGGSWGSSYTVAPARNGSTNPYGTCGVSQQWTDTTWINSSNTNQDWGLLKLNCTVGNTTGWFGYRWQSASYNGTSVTVRGYPGDKATGTMWTHSGAISASAANKLSYTIDTAVGQSGSPVYDSGNYGIAIHTNGATTVNRATRITEGLYVIQSHA